MTTTSTKTRLSAGAALIDRIDADRAAGTNAPAQQKALTHTIGRELGELAAEWVGDPETNHLALQVHNISMRMAR